MHLVFNHVTELQHVSHTYRSLLLECFTGTTIIQRCLAVARQAGLIGPFVQIVQRCTVKDRSGKLHAQVFSGTPENGLEYLTDVHT